MATFAIAQFNACADPARNLATIADFAARAAGKADLLICPEYAMGYPDPHGAAVSGQPLDGAFVNGLRELARVHSLWIVCGALEASGDPARPYNTTVVIDRTGALVRAHRKTHLYDAFSYRESDHFTPGNTLFEPLDTDFGRIGLLVCYELRFPELARLQALAGVDYLIAVAGFVCGPGKREAWHALLAARAVENGCFVIGADHIKPRVFLGESAVYAPNSLQIAALGEDEGLLFAVCDPDEAARYRTACPSLSQRRDDLYRLEAAHFS